MRKIIVLTFMSIDGVMQAPGGPEEDTANGFAYGGWSAPFSDEESGKLMQKQMKPTDLLLGRKTFDIFEGYWPQHAQYWPGINESTKYVLSNTRNQSNWENTVFINNVEDIKNLKETDGGDIKVWGSSQLAQLLLQHDLVDEMWLKIYPIVLGKGKNLFSSEVLPAAFELTESSVTSKGVIFANYKRAGDIQTGSFA